MAAGHPPKSAQPLQDPSVAKKEELHKLDMKVEEQRRLAERVYQTGAARSATKLAAAFSLLNQQYLRSYTRLIN